MTLEKMFILLLRHFFESIRQFPIPPLLYETRRISKNSKMFLREFGDASSNTPNIIFCQNLVRKCISEFTLKKNSEISLQNHFLSLKYQTTLMFLKEIGSVMHLRIFQNQFFKFYGLFFPN